MGESCSVTGIHIIVATGGANK